MRPYVVSHLNAKATQIGNGMGSAGGFGIRLPALFDRQDQRSSRAEAWFSLRRFPSQC